MKITKSDLKKIILEILEGNDPDPVQQSAREKSVERGLGTGGSMQPEEYAQILKNTLLSPKVTAQNRLAALDSIFPGKGTTINGWILELAKQMKQGA